MKICIYDKYFSTLGGGEKHIGAVAEILSKKHKVYIFHCGTVEKEDFTKRLNLNLDKVSFIEFVPIKNFEAAIIAITKELQPDVFINATYFFQVVYRRPEKYGFDFFPKYIYPTAFSFKEMVKYSVGKTLFNEYASKLEFHNFGSLEFNHGCFGRWSYAHSQIEVRSKFSNVKIYYENFRNGIIKDTIKYIRLSGRLNFYFDEKKFYFHFNYTDPNPALLELGFNTFIPAEEEAGSIDTRALGLFITLVEIDTFSLLTKFIIRLWRTKRLKHMVSRLLLKAMLWQNNSATSIFKKNELILSNSKYTSGWINRLYGKQANHRILYPPVNVNDFYTAEKKNYIIAVGRFFVGDHNKKQLELIKFFKRMYDSLPEVRSYTFHLCGGTHSEERNENYLKLCYISSEGYPIHIHPNIKYHNLRELYAQSKIFWHASGLYENEQNDPDKFEHFGITTVEAMASGCVPIVIGLAGQIEIVEDNINGFHWHSEEQLINTTRKVILNDELRKKIALNAMKRAHDFDQKHFENNVRMIFEENNIEV